jgi:alpha-tubulin suppressor-like RCC1 family protein
MKFAQDTVGRKNTAIAIACSTYHTLTITASGQLYANGLGKGGRLGTGNEKPCATPTLIGGPLQKQFVVAIAAAENHSLCITKQGYVYAFGSNGFGQLGISNNHQHSSSNNGNTNLNARCLPRRVDDLKYVTCIKVAAGLKHSVAMSKDGEIYVWGDNSSGQLGIQGFGSGVGGGSGNSNSNTIYKVTRIDSLWNAKPHPKVAIDIAASDQSTIALISGSGQKGFAVNTIYAWGNGNHIPCKVQFELSTTHIINPIAISCAKYHNVALTSNGHVYSWGLHADPLGTQNSSNAQPRRNRSSSIENDKVISKYSFTTKATTTALTAPQLVSGMLPENGGGKVVSIAASENHTAVLTEDGHLWTWGDTYKQSVLGHEGVRWQPEPKRVPGVHRAVAVAVAKEHTVLLIGTSFPPTQTLYDANASPLTFPTLERLAAKTISQHCDLFNVIPIMTIAERTQTKELLQYCKDFVRLNLDGILNVGQKSAIDSYLNEQLLGSSLERSEQLYNDETIHPLVSEVILAGSDDHESFIKDRLCGVDKWIHACADLSRQPLVQSQVKRIQRQFTNDAIYRTSQVHSKMTSALTKPAETKVRGNSFSEEKYEELTANMDITTVDLAEAKLVCLTKEARAIRKRLAHISKLENSQDNMILLTNEQKQKIARRYQLETSLKKLDPAIQLVEEKLRSLRVLENHERMMKDEPENTQTSDPYDMVDSGKIEVAESETKSCTVKGILRCEICAITCPDSISYELHMNGRKHRNRVEQVGIHETKEAAASIIEEHNKQLLLQSIETPLVPKQEKICAWGPKGKSAAKPKYTLPPPPHPVTDAVMTQSDQRNITLSLQDIMADEEKKARQKATRTKATPFLKRPVGCPTTFHSPPWETATKLQSMQPSTKVVPPTKLTPKVDPSFSPLHASSNTATNPKSTFSLADFIPPPKQTPQVPVVTTSKSAVAWITPKKDVTSSVSLKEIQVQEQDFKMKQDQTFGTPNSNNKWFIEQRERAGSFKDIQGETAKEEEERLFIEEQKRIEKQIYDDIAAASAAAINAKKSNLDDPKSNQQKRRHRKPGRKPTNVKSAPQPT